MKSSKVNTFLKKLIRPTILALGMMLAILCSGCRPPTIAEPQPSCVISIRLNTFNCGPRNLDYQSDRKTVGEWADLSYNIYGSIDEIRDGSLLEGHKLILSDLERKIDDLYKGDIKNAPKEFQKLYLIEKFRVDILTKSLEIVSFTTESWLTKIKPKMKEGAQFFIDANSK